MFYSSSATDLDRGILPGRFGYPVAPKLPSQVSTPVSTPPTSTVPGGTGTLPGSTQSGAGPFGTVPTVPSPGTTSKSAIEWNLENLAAIHNILNDIDPTVGTRRGIISDKLAGQVPADVEYLLAQQAAERGIGGGSVNADYLRALGLTSLGLQREGASEAGNLAGEVRGIESPMFVTPDQAQQAQYIANLLASSPNPREAAQVALDLQNAGRRSVGVPNVGSGGYVGSPGINRTSSSMLSRNAPAGARDTYDRSGPAWPAYPGDELDFAPITPSLPSPTSPGPMYNGDPSFNQIPGFGFSGNTPPDYVSARTGSQFDYGNDDYGTDWENFPGFEFMNSISPAPSSF